MGKRTLTGSKCGKSCNEWDLINTGKSSFTNMSLELVAPLKVLGTLGIGQSVEPMAAMSLKGLANFYA